MVTWRERGSPDSLLAAFLPIFLMLWPQALDTRQNLICENNNSNNNTHARTPEEQREERRATGRATETGGGGSTGTARGPRGKNSVVCGFLTPGAFSLRVMNPRTVCMPFTMLNLRL